MTLAVCISNSTCPLLQKIPIGSICHSSCLGLLCSSTGAAEIPQRTRTILESTPALPTFRNSSLFRLSVAVENTSPLNALCHVVLTRQPRGE